MKNTEKYALQLCVNALNLLWHAGVDTPLEYEVRQALKAAKEAGFTPCNPDDGSLVDYRTRYA